MNERADGREGFIYHVAHLFQRRRPRFLNDINLRRTHTERHSDSPAFGRWIHRRRDVKRYFLRAAINPHFGKLSAAFANKVNQLLAAGNGHTRSEEHTSELQSL